jgi:hypothetical protein
MKKIRITDEKDPIANAKELTTWCQAVCKNLKIVNQSAQTLQFKQFDQSVYTSSRMVTMTSPSK